MGSDEFQMTLRAVDTDAEKLHFGLEFTPGIAQVAGLDRAPGSIILRLKI